MQSLHRFAVLLVLAAVLTACAKQEADGTIAVIDGQQKLIRDKEEEKRVCASAYCEPNYTLYASFGRRRWEPPVPTLPPPNPSPTPPPAPGGKVHSGNYSHRQLNVAEAWRRTQGDPGVVVAIVDSGAELSHPDLVTHFAYDSNRNVGYDFLRNQNRPDDEAGHGTHVAGIIAQIAPRVKLMPLKFIGGNGQGGTYDAIRAIDYAVSHGAQVINASWGGPSYSQLLEQAVQRAMSAGVTFVAAAGNESNNFDYTPSFPAGFAGVISVAANDRNDQLAEYSNYGNNVTVAASGDEIISTVMGGGWDYMSGTSMASPQVAGTVALMKSARGSQSQAEVAQDLCQSADSFSSGTTRCGRMNTGRAVNRW